MKRLPHYKNPEYGIKKYYPLFHYEQCDKCKMEYKREWMWKIRNPGLLNGWWDYFCKECMPSRVDALLYRKKVIKL
jgi:hypothetical protein